MEVEGTAEMHVVNGVLNFVGFFGNMEGFDSLHRIPCKILIFIFSRNRKIWRFHHILIIF